MQERSSRVNVRKLIRDLADMYSDHPFDVVIAEIVANSLDSKAKSISIDWDNNASVLTVTDDGEGMDEQQFEEYHDLAAELKSRGTGIGFAGVGAKISFNIAGQVITETRRNGRAYCSDWSWSDNDSLVWRNIQPGRLSSDGTRVEVHFDRVHLPLNCDTKYLSRVLRNHFLPLFITEFVRSYERSGVYSVGPKVAINGMPMPRGGLKEVLGLSQSERFPIKKDGRSVGLGAIGLAGNDAANTESGVLLCTHGKVIKSDMFGLQTGALGAGLSGIVEIPELVKFVTTNKSGLKGGRGGHRELDGLLHPVREKLKEFLSKHGVTQVEQRQNKLSANLERELTKMVKSLPELQDFDGLLAKSRKLRRSENGNISSEVATRQRTNENSEQGNKQDKDGDQESSSKSSKGTLQQNDQGQEQGKRQSTRKNQGPRVAFEEHPDRHETAWLDSSIIVINSGHKAYRQRISQDQAKLTYCMFSIGVALDKAGLIEPSDGFSYVDKFIAAWGSS